MNFHKGTYLFKCFHGTILLYFKTAVVHNECVSTNLLLQHYNSVNICQNTSQFML